MTLSKVREIQNTEWEDIVNVHMLMTSKPREIQKIDWAEIVKVHGYTVADTPEEILHELSHVFDIMGEGAFHQTGMTQKEIALLCKKHYKTPTAADESEVRVSALTFLVCEIFGQTDLHETISSAGNNVSGNFKHQVNEMFIGLLNDSKLKSDAKTIALYILSNFSM